MSWGWGDYVCTFYKFETSSPIFLGEIALNSMGTITTPHPLLSFTKSNHLPSKYLYLCTAEYLLINMYNCPLFKTVWFRVQPMQVFGTRRGGEGCRGRGGILDFLMKWVEQWLILSRNTWGQSILQRSKFIFQKWLIRLVDSKILLLISSNES